MAIPEGDAGMYGTTTQPVDPKIHIEMEHARAQRNFAMIVLIFAFFLLLIVSLGAFSDKTLDPQMVFTTITTLVGTWVGTLLAFYYSRENFESASRSMQQTIENLSPTERLSTVKIEEAMIPRREIVAIELKADQKLDTLLLSDLTAKFKAHETATRMPILSATGAVVAMVHESILEKFLRAHPEFEAPKMADLLADRDLGAMPKLYSVVASGRTLREAKLAMESQPGCKDVFVTSTGSVAEKVVGWITDTRILFALDA